MRHQDVLKRGQFGQQVIELKDEPKSPVPHQVALALGQFVDALALEEDLACLGPIEQAQDVQERALARPAGAHDREHFASLDFEIDAAQHRDLVLSLPVALRQPARPQMSSRHFRLPWS